MIYILNMSLCRDSVYVCMCLCVCVGGGGIRHPTVADAGSSGAIVSKTALKMRLTTQ